MHREFKRSWAGLRETQPYYFFLKKAQWKYIALNKSKHLCRNIFKRFLINLLKNKKVGLGCSTCGGQKRVLEPGTGVNRWL